jgi:hypothetical protein
MPAASRPSAGQRLSARIALGFAIFLAVAEAVRNWGDWGFWPFWVVDYIAVVLLAVGARKTLRASGPGPDSGADAAAWLAGGWGFACAMFYMSFFSHVAELRADPNAADHGPIDHLPLTIAIGVLFAITVVGLATSLRPRDS